MHRFNLLQPAYRSIEDTEPSSDSTLLCSLWEAPPSATSERFALDADAIRALEITLNRFTRKE